MPADPLAQLNQRQYRFITEYVFGEHFGNASKCYAMAYERPDPTEATCRVNACRLLKKPKVKAALESLRAEYREQARLTPELHMALLQSIRDDARNAEQFSAAVRAEELRGKVMGFYAQRHIHAVEPTTREEVATRLQRLVTENPCLRDLMAGTLSAAAEKG